MEEESPFFQKAEEFCASASFLTLFLTLGVYWVQAAYFPDNEEMKKVGCVVAYLPGSLATPLGH